MSFSFSHDQVHKGGRGVAECKLFSYYIISYLSGFHYIIGASDEWK